MATGEAGNGEEQKATARAIWALGDYHRFAKQTVWDVGPVLVEACGITAGQRVLDVAAGTGNVALRAAQAGAEVVASDLTPENLEAGRREARALGLELEWVEADAEALPFADGAFDVVTSSFGAMFAPTTGRWRTSSYASVAQVGRSEWPTSCPTAPLASSSRSSAGTRRHHLPVHSRRCSGGTRSTCASSSATVSTRSS